MNSQIVLRIGMRFAAINIIGPFSRPASMICGGCCQVFLGGALAAASTSCRGQTLKLVTEVVPFGRRAMASPIIMVLLLLVVVVMGRVMLLRMGCTTVAHKMTSVGPF